MKRIIKTYSIYILVAAIGYAVISCDDLLDIPSNPPDKITEQQAFSDSANVMNVISGIYRNFAISGEAGLSFHNGVITLYAGLSSDELVNTNNNSEETSFYTNSLLPNNNRIQSLWNQAYTSIYHINAALEGIAESGGISASFKTYIASELKTLRALYYFNLVNLFGPVPIVTGTDFKVNSQLPRTKVEDVYALIIADLEEATKTLKKEYPSPNRSRPNVYVAKALLAKAHLYLENWQKAADLSGEVIDSASYMLEPDLNNVFVQGSPEAIWQIPPHGFFQTKEGFIFVPSFFGTAPDYEITPSLLNAFEPGDFRRMSWVGEAIVQVNDTLFLSYFHPFKYKINSFGFPPEEYMILRLSEQYLIRAEARSQLNQTGDALLDLNAVRARAGLTDLSFTDKETLLADIMRERRIELFCEWGNRWYDLKRMDMADAVLDTTKVNWEPTDVLYPIPAREMRLLGQNLGYN